MSDRLIALLRTVIPGLWASVVTWAVSLGVPETATDTLLRLGEIVLYPLILGAVYEGIQWLQPRVPTWLAVLLGGSSKTPTYGV